ncbi:MAG: hypothetical protein RIK87_24140 [Fuerstiella sp.]
MKIRLTAFLLAGLCATGIGCGGGEDFSAPPSELADIRARAKKKPKPDPPAEDAGKPAPAAKATGQLPDSAKSSDSDATAPTVASTEKTPASLPTESVKGPPASSQKTDANRITVETSTPADASSPTPPATGTNKPASAASPRNREATAEAAESEVVTAGGKTATQLKTDQDSQESTAAAGMSLLEKLKATSDDESGKPARQGTGAAVRKVIERTGRFAIAAQTWLQLRNQLARRFYVAATADGSKIAASSGERSLGVLSTQVEVLGEELSWTQRKRTVAAVRRDRQEITTQPVTGLSGVLTSLELLDHGQVVLAGTEDGRLIARHSANLQDWDLYARDLFAFQDERRPSVKIAESAVVAVRAVDDELLLTATKDGVCQLWARDAVVQPLLSPLEMTEEQAQSPEASVVTAEPRQTVDLPAAHLLSLHFSRNRKFGAAITADEQVTVFSLSDGRVTDRITASQLDDTQPVSAVIEEQRQSILVGLADGRIFRRALSGGEPVQGVSDDGTAVDFDVVFAPDLQDRSGPVTSMELKPDGTMLYFGRLDGTVCSFDLPRRQMQKTDRRHNGPVIEIRSTRAGVFTVGDDRLAKLSDRPLLPQAGLQRTVPPLQTFRLPTDAGLKARELVESGDTPVQSKFTVRRNFNQDATATAQTQLELTGIRPADPVTALYEHRLRVATSEEVRKATRDLITSRKAGPASPAETPRYASDQPRLLAEVQTEFDFQSRPFRRVVMSVSDNGHTLTAAQSYSSTGSRGPAAEQPVMAWDVPTGTRLRAWRRAQGVSSLHLQMDSGLILPSPLSARLDLLTGRFEREEQPNLSSRVSPQGKWLAVGLAGMKGMATNVVSLLETGTAQRLAGVEAFEGAATAVAWSEDEKSIFVNVRERNRIRLLELESRTLQPRAEISEETTDGIWNVDAVDVQQNTVGATRIAASPAGRLLVTYGRYFDTESPYQLRIWRKSNERWPHDQMVVMGAKQSMLEVGMTDAPIAFVNGQETFIAVVGTKGIGVINTRSGRLDDTLELPDVGDRRPVALLSPNGQWAMAGDEEGNVWIWNLRSLKRPPLQFAAHAGPVTGLTMSRDSHFLATAGEENRIRVWDMAEFLSGTTQTSGGK